LIMRVALVHEFLTQLGGAERVLQSFHEMFPDAPVYTLVYDREKTGGIFNSWDIRTSFLQKFPGGARKFKWYLPLMPLAIRSFDLSCYDLVLSDSSAFAKGVVTDSPTLHICYCHTPTRYLWESMDEYVSGIKYPWLMKIFAKVYLKHVLKNWDFRAAQRPDALIANSRTVQERIKKYYGRKSDVIYPPVDTQWFGPGEGGARGREYYFTASRLEPYKRIDIVVEAFNRLGLALKVAGDGTDAAALKKSAGINIEFLGRVSDVELRALYRSAKAFVFPALEDAGIAVLEALACGTPVIGFAQGGTPEFVRDGKNGVLFAEQTAADIMAAVKRFEQMAFDPVRLRESILEFGKAKFKENIFTFIHAHRH